MEAIGQFLTEHWLGELIAAIVACFVVGVVRALRNAPTYDDMDR